VWEGLELMRGMGWPVSRAHSAAGFASVRWRARFQVLPRTASRKTLFVIDGAHNEEAARAFASTWKSSPFSGEPAVSWWGSWDKAGACSNPGTGEIHLYFRLAARG
jgi:folylpolyglutamate synthase/dihydropteroate synthase